MGRHRRPLHPRLRGERPRGRRGCGRAGVTRADRQRRVGTLDLRWCGVPTGKSFVGAVGEGDARDFTALGDTVNMAARLTDVAAAGEILISAEAAAAGSLATTASNDAPWSYAEGNRASTRAWQGLGRKPCADRQEFNGSDGTRTRDLRRDRHLPGNRQ